MWPHITRVSRRGFPLARSLLHCGCSGTDPCAPEEGSTKSKCRKILDLGPGCAPKPSVPGMARWAGRTALVTGANSGIGRAICEKLIKQGMTVIGCDLTVDCLKVLMEELETEQGKLIPYRCDITHDINVAAMFTWATVEHCGPDVVVCCAGVAKPGSIIDGKTEDWRTMLECNVLGTAMCSKSAVCSMVRRKVCEGHIIHVSSIEGYQVPRTEDLHFFSACKHAVRALGDSLRQEVNYRRYPIRVSQISPGYTNTNFGCEMYDGDRSRMFRTLYPENAAILDPKNIATAAIFIISAPPHVQVDDIRLRPRGQPD